LQGADLSTAQLHGPELLGAKLHSYELLGDWLKQAPRGTSTQNKLGSNELMLREEGSWSIQRHNVKQTRQTLTEREAYVFGEHAILGNSDSAKIRRLFTQGFNFFIVHQLFDTWLAQLSDNSNENEIHAMWIGFAHQICDLYHEEELEK
jgi:hypothetical protein